MRSGTFRSIAIKFTLAASLLGLLFSGGMAVAQQQISLTAAPTTTTLPDGTVVPMWGYTCGAAVTGSTATCASLNPAVTPLAPGWSPVVITVPTGQNLQINLTNSLTFQPPTPVGGVAPAANSVPTSLVIVGQLGGGLGTTAMSIAGPAHPSQTSTWPIAGNGSFKPPGQGQRVQSFSTEVAYGATSSLTWTAPKPGTYLIESGTHPSIQGPMGLYGILVVTAAPANGATGTAYPASGSNAAIAYNAEIPLLFSEIDPAQNNGVNAAVTTAGFNETAVWSGQPGGCGNPLNADLTTNPTYNTCYPPAVNYTPLYYLINGLAFDKTHATSSLFAAAPAAGVSGTVLVRMVNAGLRMHVPSIVGAQTGTATAGFSLIAEDGNLLPGMPRVQSEVFMAAGKTYDVMMNVPAATTALPIFDRELSLSGNAVGRDSGMLAYVSVNGASLPAAAAFAPAVARNDTYNSVVAGGTVSVTDPNKGLIANDTNVYGVSLLTAPTGGTLTLNANGTFTYVANTGTASDSFTYCANGSVTAGTCSSGITASVALGAATIEGASGITVNPMTYTSNVATSLSIKSPGILSVDKDAAGYTLSVSGATANVPLQVALTGPAAGTVTVDANGGFNASVTTAGTYTFSYRAQNSQGTVSAASATVTLIFQPASGLVVKVKDGKTGAAITDYRWIIEEDRSFYIDPSKTTNTGGTAATTVVPTLGTNFHTSYMPVVATGCTGPTGSPPVSCEAGQYVYDPTTGGHVPAVCDIGNGICRTNASAQTPVDPGQVHLDPTKRYYISVLPGDAANPFNTSNAVGGNGMGGAPIPIQCVPVPPATICTPTAAPAVTVLAQPTPNPPAKLAVFVFEDDFPLNGENDASGLPTRIAPNEPGLGQFNITLFDDAGGTGDPTGQMTYDMFNMPLSNSLSGTIDPTTGLDACPISAGARQTPSGPSPTGITGTIVTCPKYESDGVTLSPLAGQAVVANLMPGRYGVVATPGADRIAAGEEWLQTNTLDGQKAHDSFLRVGEPSFFQEYGPAGYHVSIGFANPKIINSRLAGVCAGTDPNITGTNCSNTVTGIVTTERMSRTPDERLYSSGTNDSFAFTQCYVSFGDADGEDFAFTKCKADGTFTLSGLPDGDWRITVFDQWNDMLVDGLSTPVRLDHTNAASGNLGQIAINQWQANIYTTTFIDTNGNGVRDANEAGLTLVPTNIRFRDGSFSNFNNTDLAGNAGFNEVFPLFSWYVIETDSTRYKNTGTHVVYDAGGPADGTCTSTTAPCGSSTIGMNMANTVEQISLPTALRFPGAVYCATADCTGKSILSGPGSSDPPSNCSTSPTTGLTTCGAKLSTGRIDPPWVTSEGWQGFSGQNSFIEFGKKPFVPGENGGIRGHVVYASTRPFDDPQLLLQTSWEPLVPGVTINLYQEGLAADGVTQTLTLVDSTKTSSWDDWAQGFRADGMPNMNCPGQMAAPTTSAAGDLFFFSLYNQPMWLDVFNNGGTPAHAMPNNAQFKCYDGMHNWNQVQPAPYDGMYKFPSIVGRNPANGAPAGTGTAIDAAGGSMVGTSCTICVANPTDGTPMLPAGKYVVEVVVPPGYELVKEEDKNILIGDNYIAPVTQQFGGLGNIFILPDQASVAAAFNANAGSRTAYNANNAQNPTQALGRMSLLSSHEGDTGSVESYWPCVGALRIVPDYISLFPQSKEVAPFAGATRHLCDRKEVSLDDQTSALAKFYIFTSTHAAAHFTGIITDDFTSEFDPFSPSFGEKFSPANLPISIKDWSGTEVSRVYSDQWGSYNGLTYSTWEVNPPNPTGYAPTMMVTCMNDKGPILDTRANIVNSSGATVANPTFGQMINDPLYNPSYSQFCYEIPFMPGQTQYMDTPVTPTSAFAGAGYNNPDCAYPNATPAISEVDGDGIGPWVSAAGNTLNIYALGDQAVPNNGYSGPSASTVPFNQKMVTRHYGFGAAAGTVTIGGVAAPVSAWSDGQITVIVPAGVPACAVQQQAEYGGSAAQCGELVITTAASATYPNGQQSIDTVTVTIGGKAPTHVSAAASIQSAIDAAAPGDLLMIDPATQATATAPAVSATHSEMLLMWKPLRLQGVAAVSSIIDGNAHPAGKIDVWRRQVNCLFGLALNGSPAGSGNTYDPSGAFSCPGTGWNYFSGAVSKPQVDRITLEPVIGWDATQNGNLAEMLQEPSLMGALEGASITVLSKGLMFPAGSDPFGANAATPGVFPTGTTMLSKADCGANPNPYPSNFWCNPSSIDGLGVTDSSQGGGGIFVHGWGHNIQIANNRVANNSGTLSGGINIGQGELPGALTVGTTPESPPSSCQTSDIPNLQLPYCFNMYTNVHHNAVTLNASTGDELFSATPAGAGGVSFCTGADYYQFNYNWVCGNLSTGDGGGFGHLGFSYYGSVEHNSIIFNQSSNPTIAANGGGMIIMGTPDVDPPCGLTTDLDCVPPLGSVGPSDGIGPGLVINANLIMGNAAESGSGGGIAFQNLNGSDVVSFPSTPSLWHSVSVTNNIIVNNVAGWDGAGISLLDALNVNIINNTFASNDTTASSGPLFNTLGAPLASTQGPCPPGLIDPATGLCLTPVTTSSPQPAGLVSLQNSAVLTANVPANVTVVCPPGHFAGENPTNGTCRRVSFPLLANNAFFRNRDFHIAVGGLGSGTLNQQNVVTLDVGATTTRAPSQTATGACPTPAAYWDVGVRGDTGPTNHASGVTLFMRNSLLTTTSGGYGGFGNRTGNGGTFVKAYCNGSRVPPEETCTSSTGQAIPCGWQVPPGIADATVPNPIFNLTPAATVDEGNNWINISWGPLSVAHPVTGVTLGNYAPAAGSPAINGGISGPIPGSGGVIPPNTDYFGNLRTPPYDIGAIEVGAVAGVAAPVMDSLFPISDARGAVLQVTLAGLNLTGATAVNVAGGGISVSNVTVENPTAVQATFTIAANAALGPRLVTVTTPNGTSNALSFRVTGANVAFSAITPALTTAPATTTVKTGTITVTNSAAGANAGPLTLTGAPSVTRIAGAGTFAVTGGTCAAGLVVEPGANCTVTVQYTPGTSTANSTAYITLTDTGATTPSQNSRNFNAN